MTNTRCQCSDRSCPVHPGINFCVRTATTTLFRIDMDDQTGTPLCEGCAEDAMKSALFTEVR